MIKRYIDLDYSIRQSERVRSNDESCVNFILIWSSFEMNATRFQVRAQIQLISR